jgi:hypothetical protein
VQSLNKTLKQRNLEPQPPFFESLLENRGAEPASEMNPPEPTDIVISSHEPSEILNASIPGSSASSLNEHVAELPTFATRSEQSGPLYSSFHEHMNNLQSTIQRMSFSSLK